MSRESSAAEKMIGDFAPKLVDLVRAALPDARRLAVLINPLNATNRPIFERVRAAGGTVGLEVRAIEVSAPDGIDDGFGPRSAAQPDAVLVAPDALFIQLGGRIAALGIERRIAVLGPSRDQAEAGALLSYGAPFTELVRRSAFYVKRILAGAQPRDLRYLRAAAAWRFATHPASSRAGWTNAAASPYQSPNASYGTKPGRWTNGAMSREREPSRAPGASESMVERIAGSSSPWPQTTRSQAWSSPTRSRYAA